MEVQPVASSSRVKVVDDTANVTITTSEQAGPSTSSEAMPNAGESTQGAIQQQTPQSPMPILENPEWGLKEIIWPPEPWEGQPQYRVRIVTQNANGPCSFIAICKSHYRA
jgi:hypothetical protein